MFNDNLVRGPLFNNNLVGGLLSHDDLYNIALFVKRIKILESHCLFKFGLIITLVYLI